MRQLVFLLFSISIFAQKTPKVDFTKCNGNITINPVEKKVLGFVQYDFVVNQAIDTIRIDAQKMNFYDVKINGQNVKFDSSGKELKLFEGFRKGKNKLTFNYEVVPSQTMYFVGRFDCDKCNKSNVGGQVWTQGQGKNTSYWFPSFDDMNEKLVFNLTVRFDKKYKVVSNGALVKKTENEKVSVWEYQMKKPMSSYLLALAIGDFSFKTFQSHSGIENQLYIKSNEMEKFESTYRYSKQIFDYLETKIGLKYPWQNYKQIPVEDFLYGGMENTSCTLYAQDYVVDNIGFNDQNYVYVNAHELAHQWFGDLITEKSGKHHWLHESFATYYGMLAEKEIFGEDYFYHKMYRNALKIEKGSFTDTIPILNEKASTLSFYQKGAWALFDIVETIGEKTFRKAVKTYLKKYRFKNVETADFLAEIKKVAPTFDTEKFQKLWLEDYHFPTERANDLLRKNTFMKLFFETQQMRKRSFEENNLRYLELLKSDVFYPVKTEILYQIKDVSFEDKKELLEIALATNDLKVRQAVAEYSKDISYFFREQFETLLDDDSYDTREMALTKLFYSFPENQLKYLAKAKNWYGNNDLSLRITYLYLSQHAQGFDIVERENNKKELIEFTSDFYESSIRQNAFNALLQMDSEIDSNLLRNLINTTTHFKWQIAKYAKEQLKELLKDEKIKNRVLEISTELNDKEKVQLQKLIQ